MRFAPLLLALSALQAQPVITPKGIANSASFLPAGLPGGAIARGSTFTLFGSGLGPAAAAQQPSYPLQTTLAGVSIKVTQGSTAVNAIPTYVSDAAINAIMPSNAPLGLVSVKVTYNGKASNPQTVRVVSNNPGLFSATGFGYGPGAIYNFSNTGAQVNSPLHPAQPGQTIALFGNGLGPITQADTDTPPVANLPFKAELFIGGVAVTDFAYVGRLPGVAGIDQINFQLPANVPQGCYVPVTLRMASTAVSNTVTMAITSTGAACTDSFNTLALGPVKGGTVGRVLLQREVRTEDVQVANPVTVTTDLASAYFARFPGSEFAFHPMFSLPAPGTCATYGASGVIPAAIAHSALTTISAGPLSVSGGASSVDFERVTDEGDPFDVALLGLDAAVPGIPSPPPPYLNPGTFHVKAGGSGDVGAFAVDLNVASAPNWTNRSQITVVDTKQPLTLNWSGGGQMLIIAQNRDFSTNSTSQVICTAPAGAISFTIPAYALATMPLTRPRVSSSDGFLELHSIGPVQQINVSNLNFGAALMDFVSRRSVVFK